MRTLSFVTVLFSILFVAACSGGNASIPSQDDASSLSSSSSVASGVTLLFPLRDFVVKSPVTVIGTAPNTWYFEGSLPVQITDDAGAILAEGPAMTKDDWMSDGMHPFSVDFTFTTKAVAGFIVIKKDNPSGDTERDAEVKVPVRFQ